MAENRVVFLAAAALSALIAGSVVALASLDEASLVGVGTAVLAVATLVLAAATAGLFRVTAENVRLTQEMVKLQLRAPRAAGEQAAVERLSHAFVYGADIAGRLVMFPLLDEHPSGITLEEVEGLRSVLSEARDVYAREALMVPTDLHPALAAVVDCLGAATVAGRRLTSVVEIAASRARQEHRAFSWADARETFDRLEGEGNASEKDARWDALMAGAEFLPVPRAILDLTSPIAQLTRGEPVVPPGA